MRYSDENVFSGGMTGKEIKEIRSRAGLTQEQFGEQLGLSKRQVWSLEHNEKNNTQISELIRGTLFTRPRRPNGISGRRVASIRKASGLSQVEFGRKLGLSKRQIWTMEHKERNSMERRIRLSKMEPPSEDVLLSGSQLKLIREMTGLSQAKFGKALGHPQSSINTMEHRESNPAELSERVRGAFPEEYESVTERFEVRRSRKKPEAKRVGLGGTEIRKIRACTGFTQAEFAKRIGISHSYLAAKECGNRCSLRVELAIAETFPEEYRMVVQHSAESGAQVLTGAEVRRIRHLTGMNQTEFGECVGISQSGLSECEMRNAATLSLSTRIRMAFPIEYGEVARRGAADR